MAFRSERVGSLIQEKISLLLSEGKIKDPRVSSFLSITKVNVSKDLSFADVYVSNIRAEANIEKGAEGLNKAAGYIQSRLGEIIRIRKIPHLRFHADSGIREGYEMIKMIDSLNINNKNEEKEDDEKIKKAEKTIE